MHAGERERDLPRVGLRHRREPVHLPGERAVLRAALAQRLVRGDARVRVRARGLRRAEDVVHHHVGELAHGGVQQLGVGLARAGVGFLRIVDRDYVEWSNLQRQVLIDEQDAQEGAPKAAAAVEQLRRINSEIQYEAVVEDDVKQAAAVVATFAYHAATRAERLPREAPPQPQPKP